MLEQFKFVRSAVKGGLTVEDSGKFFRDWSPKAEYEIVMLKDPDKGHLFFLTYFSPEKVRVETRVTFSLRFLTASQRKRVPKKAMGMGSYLKTLDECRRALGDWQVVGRADNFEQLKDGYAEGMSNGQE